jgi:hypothetical protein
LESFPIETPFIPVGPNRWSRNGAPPGSMNIDIYGSVQALIRQHGEAAAIVAAQRADELLARGDLEGKAAWLSILRAIEQLQRQRGEGEALN